MGTIPPFSCLNDIYIYICIFFFRCDFFRAFSCYKRKRDWNHHFIKKICVFWMLISLQPSKSLSYCRQVTWRWLQNYIQQQPQLKGFLPAVHPTGAGLFLVGYPRCRHFQKIGFCSNRICNLDFPSSWRVKLLDANCILCKNTLSLEDSLSMRSQMVPLLCWTKELFPKDSSELPCAFLEDTAREWPFLTWWAMRR